MFENDPQQKSADIWNVAIKASIALGIVISIAALCAYEKAQNQHTPPTETITAPS